MSGGLLWKRGQRKSKSFRALVISIPKTERKTRTKDFPKSDVLEQLYIRQKLSARDIAIRLGYSQHKINYWLERYNISKRSLSEAIYVKHNPAGDPFDFREPKNLGEAILYGFGLGLYWGEGTKADLGTVRLGNTDPALIRKFIEFLEKMCGVPRARMRFGLQVFSDMAPGAALDFWVKNLKISKAQFYKVTVTKARSLGTYRKKSQYGVLTVYYHNKKLRDLLISSLPM